MNLSHGELRRAREDLPRRPQGRDADRPRGRRSWSTCRVRRSASAASSTARSTLADGDEFTITTDDVDRHRRRGRHHLRRPARGRRARRPPADRRRQGRPARHRGRPTPTSLPGDRRRHGLQQQGHQPARRRASTCRRCPRRTRTTCAGRLRLRRRHDRPVLRPQRLRHRAASTRSWTRTGAALPVIAKIEKPQAVENLDEIIDAFDAIMVARGDLGVELPLEEVPIVQKRAIEMARRMRQAGHRRHPGARVDDRQPAADPRRGLRRRQRRPRRCGRASCSPARPASGRTRSITVQTMARIIESTEEHGLERDPPARHQAAHAGRRDHRRPPSRSPTCSTRSTSSPSPSRATPPAACRGSAPDPACSRSRPEPATRSRLALTWGIETFLVPDGAAHRPDGRPGRRGRCSASAAVEEGDMVVDHRRFPSRNPRLHQRAPRPQGGRRDQRGGPGLRGPRGLKRL